MKGKIWKIILGTSTILSGIGNAIKIFETTGGKNMKIDLDFRTFKPHLTRNL